jgi:hypothetical protein
MEKDQEVARIELTEALRTEPREQTEVEPEPAKLEIDELESRIAPSSIGTFF